MAQQQADAGKMDTTSLIEPKELRTRAYQKEMFEQSMKRNVIVAMDTGSGKTAIAVIRMMAELDRCPAEKLIWFLAPTVVLCIQQHDYIRSHLPAVKLRLLTGLDNVDRWSEQRIWDAVLHKVRIVVSTHAVLADALGHGFVKMKQLALLIFDEGIVEACRAKSKLTVKAHHCARGHPANVIMRDFYHPAKSAAGAGSVPHVLGLSASLILRSKISELAIIESNLDAIGVTPRLHRQEMLRYVHHPEFQRLYYIPCDVDDASISSNMLQLLRRMYQKVLVQQGLASFYVATAPENLPLNQPTGSKPKTPAWVDQLTKFHRKASHIYEELGAWPADYFILQTVEMLRNKVDLTTRLSIRPGLGEDLRSRLLQIFDQNGFTQPPDALSIQSSISSKVEQLLKFLECQNSKDCSGLIFVQQRATVIILFTILSTHPRTKGLFKCATFVGQSGSVHRNWVISELFDLKAQEDTLAEFRAGKRNLVIATDALEEGIDVAACNLVICFNPPPGLKSFIQRRGRARKERSKFALMLPHNSDQSKLDFWKELEKELIKTYQNEERRKIEAASLEDDEELMDYKLRAQSTGALLTAERTLAHLHHFCALLSREPYVDMRPEFSFEEDELGLITCTVTLPNCVGPSLRSIRGQKAWRTERAAMKDAAFQCYAALFYNGLLNDNLLPLTHDWRGQLEQPEDLPAMIKVDEQANPFVQMAKAWIAPELHRIRIIVMQRDLNPREQLSMVLTVPTKTPRVPPITMFWDSESVFEVTLEDVVQSTPFSPDSLEYLKEITQVLERSTHSDQYVSKGTDFVALFGPDVEDNQLPTWLNAKRQRKSALEIFKAGETTVRGFVRTALLNGSPHIFCNWHSNVEVESKNAVEVECIRLLRRRNFQEPNILAGKSTILNVNSNDTVGTQRFLAKDCTVDTLDFKYARFSLFIPSILRHIEVYSVANQLQNTLLQAVRFQDVANLVTAITAPSANWITNYQRYEFIGDAVLKFQTSVQLHADHINWPEGYLSQRRDSLVSNANLARAALNKKLDHYILMEAPKTRKWSAPRISDMNLCTEGREVSLKLLADVVEALIGAAFVDSGFEAARACINVFVPEIRAGKPDMRSCLPKFEAADGEIDAETLIGYRFRNEQLLREALTHPTCGNNTSTESYQRLEFLGDAVLDALIATYLSNCKPELSPGQMTRIKAALTNATLLGFLCLDFSMDRDSVRIEETYNGQFVDIHGSEKLQLWTFMRHHSQDVVRAQKESNKRYDQYRTEIQSCLNEGESYPWAPLARLNPDKFYSDIVESIIGAIFVDSQGQLHECQRFFDRIGLGSYASRMTNGLLDVVHPRDRLQRVAGSSKVDIEIDCNKIERDGSDTACFRCTVKIDGNATVEVSGCMTEQEAYMVGADTAVILLSSAK